MSPRSPARYLAPLALLATAAVIYLLVAGGGSHGATPARATLGAGAKHLRLHRFYLVRSGDDLSGIAARNGVSVAQVQQLNPSINPDTLQPGQWIRLRH